MDAIEATGPKWSPSVGYQEKFLDNESMASLAGENIVIGGVYLN